MSEKIFIKKSDVARVLHTEVLPYEVPIIFSNQKLYRYHRLSNTDNVPPFIKKLLTPNDYSIPFDYQIWQGSRKRRTLSVIHPAWQFKFVDLYKDYGELILSLCKRSSYSLRYPSRVASYFFDRDYGAEDDGLKSGAADQEPDAFGEQPRHAATYFYYSRYSQLYRFIDSPEFLSLESRFTFLRKFDIKRCFNSIYTHSISWAVKGKAFAKANQGAHSFDQQFDELMAKINYKETNGIIIGPETSRIFAEIILQQIDLEIEKAVAKGKISAESYAIRRYVDDYYLFTRDSHITEKIFEIIQQTLQDYKLFLNESKTEDQTIPFVTIQTVAKTDVQIVLQSTILTWLNYLKKVCKEAGKLDLELPQALQLKTPYKLAAQIMRDLKIAVKRSGSSFDVVTSYALGSITKSLYRLYKASRKDGLPVERQTEFQNILLVTIEVVFFFYSMDFRVRTTYFIAQFMLIVSRVTEADKPFHDLVVTNMRAHVEKVLDTLPQGSHVGVEVHNLLIALKNICPDELLTPERLARLISRHPEKSNSIDSLLFKDSNYFDFVVILYYIGESAHHDILRSSLEQSLIQLFKDAQDIRRSAELTYLLLDVLSCPYIAKDAKNTIATFAVKNVTRKEPSISELGHIINYSKTSMNFTRWGPNIELEKLLVKKQLNPAY